MLDDLRIPLGTWVESGVDWITTNLAFVFDLVRTAVSGVFDGAELLFTGPPAIVMILV